MVSQSSSVGYTIMGKTADLTVVQKTTIDTLHKEGKTQKVIAKEAGCSQSSMSKHINLFTRKFQICCLPPKRRFFLPLFQIAIK